MLSTNIHHLVGSDNDLHHCHARFRTESAKKQALIVGARFRRQQVRTYWHRVTSCRHDLMEESFQHFALKVIQHQADETGLRMRE